MKREDIEDLYPLSPLQEGILFQVRGAPDRADYISRTAWDVRGSFDMNRFRDVWRRLIERHPILRTGFSWRHSASPVQIVFKKAQPAGRNLDWCDKDDPEQHFRWWLEADLKRGFNLGVPPLMRLTLIRLGEDHWRLVWTRHHLLLDGWSGALLLREAFQLYLGVSPGPAPPSFRRYISWLKEQNDEGAETWWRNQLRGFNKNTPIGPTRQGGKAGGKRYEIERTLNLGAPPPGLTPNTLVQGAWALRLARFAGAHDVLFGCTVAGRSTELSGSDRMIGLFINTLPLRVRHRDDQTAADWLGELQRHMAVMRGYEHSALSQIRTWSEIPSGRPFFQSIVIFENYPVDRTLSKGAEQLDVSLVFRDERTHYPLALYALPGEHGLTLRLCYDDGLFEAETAQDMVDHLAVILEQLHQHADRSLAELQLTDKARTQQLLDRWNQTARDFGTPATLVDLLMRQALATPKATALVAGETTLTYAELQRQADVVAHRLNEMNLSPETRIGVALPRDHRMVVALIGVLKAGLSYLPLDLKFPLDRLRYIVEDSGVARVFCDDTQEWLSDDRIMPWTGEDSPSSARHTHIHPQQRAYTIYTSGSTGRPKGVDIPHLAVVNFLHSMAEQPGLKAGDQLLALTTLSFDISVLELFLPLSVGATLVLADEETAADPTLLGEALEQVSHAQATPATWNMLYASGWGGRKELSVWCGGEALPQNLAGALTRDCHSLWNLYGPTETTIWSAALQIKHGDTVTVGGAIANTDIHLFDTFNRPQPVGFAGELMIGGAGLARGYHQRPALTAERFVPHPHGDGARLYRTGDLGARRSDGHIRFLGRADHQVKVRGYRIETGEIENVLRRHDQIREAVVLAEVEKGADAMLVAFVIFDEPVGDRILRAFLGARLPEYMIPGVFHACEHFPMTPNAKIDRRTLLESWRTDDDRDRAGAARIQAPRDDREAGVHKIFVQVLGLEQVCITDHFFELGGHSLQATKLLALMRKELGLNVPLRTFFEEPTVAALAAVARPFGKQEAIPAEPERTRFPLSPAQRRFLFLHRFEEGDAAYHLATAVAIEGPLQQSAIEDAFKRLNERHPILRTTYDQDVQILHPHPLVGVDHLDLRDGRNVQKVVAEAIAAPFDLEHQAPLRMTLCRTDAQAHLLVLTAHHIALDAQSLEIAVGELIAFYRDVTEGIPANRPTLPVGYGEVAGWLTVQDHQAARTYWAEQMRDLPTLGLPVDLPRPELQTFRGARLDFDIPQVSALQQLSADQGVTLFVTLLTLFKLELARWSGQNDVVVGTPVGGRERPETEAMLGCFINNLVLRTDLAGEPDLVTLLNRVRRTVLDAFTHQELPFEELVALLDAPRDLSRSPLFQVLFNFRVEQEHNPGVHALRWTTKPLSDDTAKYELSLIVRLRGGRLHAALEYNTDLFQAHTIAAFRDRFLATVAGLIVDPQRSLELNELGQASQSTPEQMRPKAASSSHPQQEALLMNVFSEVLGRPVPDADADFFALGGHSLKAVQVLTRLRREQGVGLRLKTFFLNPTPASLAAHLVAVESAQNLPTADRNARLPLSPSQARLWFAHQLDPQAGAYHMPSAVALHGEVDLPALREAVARLVARHEILRTRFPEADGEPHQEIRPDAKAPFEETHLSDDVAFEPWLNAWVARPFDLAAAAPIRLALITQGARKVLAINLHHIIGDDWSLALATREVLTTYLDLRAGRSQPPAPLVKHYADYAQWRRTWLEGTAADKDREYWRAQLADITPIELPADRHGGNEDDHAGDQLRFLIDDRTTTALEALAEQHGVTPYVLYLSLWQVLLLRLAGGSEMRIGASIAGRNHPETETMLGCFVNTLVLRTPFVQGVTFTQILAHNKVMMADALDHGDLPFEAVQRIVPRDLAAHLFPAFFVLHTAGYMIEPVKAEALKAEPLPIQLPGARFSLSLSLTREQEGLRGALSYRTNRYDQARIANLIEGLQVLMQAVLTQTEIRIDRLPLLSEAVRARCLDDGVDARPISNPTPLVTRVLAQARRTPDLDALRDDQRSLTYAQLDQQVSALAADLLSRGVGQGEVVAIAARRRVETIVAMLAVQAVGAVSLPLEIDTPAMRLTFMASDADIRFCIAIDEDHDFGGDSWTRVPLSHEAVSPIQSRAVAEGLAYLVYTSGSTGQPKAVAVGHRNLAAYVSAIASHLQPRQDQQWMVVTTLAADLGLTSIYPALATGGTVHVLPRDTVLDADAVSAEIAERRIDVLKCTPSWFRTLMDTDFPEMAIPTTNLLLGGEACDRDLVDRIRECSEVNIFNHYGPSETTVGIVVHPVDDAGKGPVPIGRPLPAATALVLDDQLQLLPEGVPGQLYLGGPQTAHGYYRRPGLTADRFLPDPFNGGGRRLYKTGDLVVRRQDGEIVFLRRLDHQLKLRGFRVELAEIEQVMQELTDQAVVLVIGEEDQIRLHAFMVGAVRVEDITAFLAERLPDYMLPSHIQKLDALPLSPNGKLDRKALIALAEQGDLDDAGTVHRAPSTQAETTLVEVWGKLLNRESLGVDDDFFKIGGDSILAIQAMIQMRAKGFQPTPADFFANPTIAAQAMRRTDTPDTKPVGTAAAATAAVATAAVATTPTTGEVPLTPIQHWFFDAHGDHGLEHFNQAIMLRVIEILSPDRWRTLLQHLIDRHEIFGYRYERHGEAWRQIATSDRALTFEICDLRDASLDAVTDLIEDHAHKAHLNFDLAKGDLHRIVLYQTPVDEPDRLLLVCHHLLVDGVSWRVLLSDLEQLAADAEPPRITAGFGACAQALDARAADLSRDFWHNLPQGDSLKPDLEQGPNDEASTQSYALVWSRDQTRRLLHDTRRHVHVYLLSALTAALAETRDMTSLRIHLEGHGRDVDALGLDAGQAVGWLTSVYPVHLAAGGDPGELMARTAAQLDAVPHNGMGFGALRYLTQDPEIVNAPAPPLIFNYLGQFDAVLRHSRLFDAATENTGPTHAPQQIRQHLIDVNASVLNDQLRVAWRYSTNRFQPQTIATIAEVYFTCLDRLIAWDLAATEVRS